MIIGYADTRKEEREISVYWLMAKAIYLAYSFTTNGWEKSWIVWLVAGVFYGAVAVIVRGVELNNKQK